MKKIKGINKQRLDRRLRRVPLWLTFTAYGGCGEGDKLGWPVLLPGRAVGSVKDWWALQGSLSALSITANTHRLCSACLGSVDHHSGGMCLPRNSSGKVWGEFVG